MQRDGLSRFPLIGRDEEIAALTAVIDAAGTGKGRTIFLAGERGIGKSRLAAAAAERAAKKKFTVAVGRAYAVEQGTPYAPWADALVPILRALEPTTLTTLSRGGDAELMSLFPMLGRAGASAVRGESPELRTRQQWTLAQLLIKLAARSPLLIVLEDLHWADASSIELLHFLARQVGEARIAIIATYASDERDRQGPIRAAEQSLQSLGLARTLTVGPLGREAIDELLQEVFGAEPAVVRDFAGVLYAWTRGNPFFVEETLTTLVATGRLTRTESGWVGWNAESMELPRSVRDAVRGRVDRLSPDARRVADLCSVIGAPVTHEAVETAAGLSGSALLAALSELRRDAVIEEEADGDEIQYRITHPILAQTLYEELGRARARSLHGEVADALERHYGDRALDHADELAVHLVRADGRGDAPRATRYLAAAGRDALARHANREAGEYLEAAAERLDHAGELAGSADAMQVLDDLARARQRLGDYDGARAALERVRDAARAAGNRTAEAAAERRMGLTAYWSGRYDDALELYEGAFRTALDAGDRALAARIQLNTGICLQELGRPTEALAAVEEALELAAGLDDVALQARVHRSLLLISLWTGPAERARAHGAEAIRLAEESGQRSLAFQAHWGMAVLGGLTGDSELTRTHLVESERLADALHSPVLRIWSAEVAIEYLSFTGDWDGGIALAERTIALARTIGRPLLPRLLVWAALMYVGRGEQERAKKYVDEAWSLALGLGTGKGLDVHSVVPAHTGMAAYHLASGEFQDAVEVGRAGVAIADRAGYVVWALHRLLPIVAEASLWASDVNGAAWIARRLRRDAERLGQKLGLAWADACDALVAMVRGNRESAVQLLREAAEQLEAIPFVADGARIRRQLARALAEGGDREGAMRELRRAHDVFARLGARRELDATREQLRDLGARPPVKTSAAGAEGLTGRELEIIRLVSERKSNRAIGNALGISPRTVSTHLSNIFGKLAVESRGELTDLYRERLRHTAT